MRGRLAISLVSAVVVAGALLGPATSAAGAAKPFVTGTDPVGDFHGLDGDPAWAPLGDVFGADLVKASIVKADAKTLEFIIEVNSLNTVPEVVRYIWGMNIDDEYVELDGKYTNYSRGTCDPTSGQCPPPRDPGQQPFLVRGDCGQDPNASNVTVCKELGIVKAVFDTTANTITIPVPMDLIGAKPKSKITIGNSDFSSQAGGNVLAILSAFFSQSNWPADSMMTTKTFVVPR